ncbi:MAG TPA: N-acetylmuramoyl-L-alanine amidase, partial [Candidatus Sulfotelmatobacter sp.]
VFVSIHANSMPTEAERRTAHGVETFFLSADASDAAAQATADRENDEGGAVPEEQGDEVTAILDDLTRSQAHADSSRLAYVVQHQLSSDLSVPDRGVKQAPFRVLMGARMPAILVEIGFISSPREGKLLLDSGYQDRVARSLAAAIAADRKDPVLSPMFADLHGLPPSLLVTSTRDLLLSDTAIFHRALLRSGNDSQLVVFEALPHAFWYHFQLPETKEALALMAKFFDEKVAK